jgi:hypothetical protein
VPTVNGIHRLSVEAFSQQSEGGSGAVELFAWDGLQKSNNVVLKYEYPKASGDQSGEENGNPEEASDDSDSFESMPPAVIVGLAFGAVALIALAVGIALFAVRKTQNESSQGEE